MTTTENPARSCVFCGKWMDLIDWTEDGGNVYECQADHEHGPEAPRPARVTCQCGTCGKTLQGTGPRRCPACARKAAQ